MASGSTEASLREAELLAKAQSITGLADFGDGYQENLHALLEMYNGSARLSAQGVKATRRRLIALLVNRLLIEQAFERHPEIRSRQLQRPMYMVGLPRTGTSAFFNLLAADPVSRPLLLWEGTYPNPIEDLAPGEPDPRMLALASGMEHFYENNPEFAKIHHARADGPEECVQLLAHTLGSVQMGIEPLISPYREYFQAQDQRANYAYYHDLLKLLDFQRPGERWLLKSPAHLWSLDVLLELFPDACIIWAHRNPAALVASYCSMMQALSNVRESVDPMELGPTVLEYLARSVERAMHARAALPADRFHDVYYDDFVADPLHSVRGTYQAFGLSLSEAAEQRMQEHVRESPRNRHGEHRYSLEQYGLTTQQVRERFASYLERFGGA
ncbi:MAG TPA: sulfotransferase [Polyangiaceae bacterium]|nr:sulfotransferase [Polyangiaceae bacterium]